MTTARAIPTDTTTEAWLDSLFVHADATATPDARPEVLVAVESTVKLCGRPPEVHVRLHVQGAEPRVYSFRCITAPEATLLALIQLVRQLDAPTRLSVGLDDPIVARLLDGEIRTPPWLRRPARRLWVEMALGDIDIAVEHLDLADDRAAKGVGVV